MCENAEGSFARMFWQQQQEAARQHDARTARQHDARTMRWCPQMIRWCLHFHLKSSGAYKLLRESGIVKLPSDRTLRDYTYFVPPKAGFQGDVESQLVKDARLESLKEWEKFVIIVFERLRRGSYLTSTMTSL